MTPFTGNVRTNIHFTHYTLGGCPMTATDVRPAAGQFRLGMLFAIASAFAFGLSGPLGKSLMEAGWSPTAAVTARLAGGAVAMAVFATAMKPNWLAEALQHWKTVL